MAQPFVRPPFVFVSEPKAAALSANLAQPGDVIFTQRGTLGQVSMVPGGSFDRYLISQSQMKVTLDAQTADAEYFYFLFTAPAQQRLIATSAIQTGVPHINLGILRRLPLLLPPLPEQRAIAAALSDVDALIASLDQLIAKKRDIKQGVMQQLLTGKTRLPGFGGEWRMSTVGAEFDVRLGKMLDGDGNVGTPRPYLGNKSVRWGEVDLSELRTMPITNAERDRYRLRSGDLLVCEGGEVGRAAIWEDPIADCYYQKALHRLRPLRGYVPKFMLALLQHWVASRALGDYVTQTSIAHLTREKFVTIPLPVPSAEEQHAIASVIDDLDLELTVLQARRDKTRLLKQGMMQELLTGKTRLV